LIGILRKVCLEDLIKVSFLICGPNERGKSGFYQKRRILFTSEDCCARHATKQDRTSRPFEVVELAVFLQESKDDTLYQISSRFPIAGTVVDCVHL
jgi:hypothetical protein